MSTGIILNEVLDDGHKTSVFIEFLQTGSLQKKHL